MNAFQFPVGVCLLALVATAAGWDLHSRRIPNWLVLLGGAVALAVQVHLFGLADGAGRWALGALIGGGLFFPLFMLRGMGAGDVKLMAAVAAFVGPVVGLEIVLLTCVMGGVWAVTMIVYKRAVKATGANMLTVLLQAGIRGQEGNRAPDTHAVFASVGSMPYGVAIALGTLAVMYVETVYGAF
ncbi:pilus assembly protein CpaA [Pandoraea terrae]|uniref:Pilus assembly protein CpaA n=1 Tax=Pandoraea terrae TaxID=1537710 RepID=A0A5E4VJA1_9BURK|nr:prepilin peptidase [Pandoraea terrae]VVE11923.1 pilus assembly protein CpaA [Pandoraea terrae]